MLSALQSASTRDVEAATGIPKSNLARWANQTTKLLAFDGTAKRFNIDGAGRPEEIPDTAALEAFMLKLRDAERAVTCTHLVNDLKRYHRAWLDGYLANKNCGYQSLLKLLQAKTQADLAVIRTMFAADYHKAFAGFSGDSIINVDETGMTYDMRPHAIWSVCGGTAKIASGEKYSYRMTAVLGARANGEKLPILFIMRGMPGGDIEANEFESYPLGHHYAVQESAWMDSQVWAMYLRKVLKPQVREPSVLLLDNFDPHVSKEGVKIVIEEAGCVTFESMQNKRKQSKRLTIHDKNSIREYFKANMPIKPAQVQRWTAEKFGHAVHITTIRRILKDERTLESYNIKKESAKARLELRHINDHSQLLG
ncbi:hypothetical protein DYB31_012242 [Aphanomyces astaci]|uniref:DDE-1 domain-containing protein n=1 Tax=Aphanomyces astaci TaxID=112090 RepID=A0A397EED5_APHAT|nr:hypothetical protein DYB31_012242 [Aphanomyces astaci]